MSLQAPRMRLGAGIPINLAWKLYELRKARKIPPVWISGPTVCIALNEWGRFESARRINQAQAWKFVRRIESRGPGALRELSSTTRAQEVA